MKRMIKESFGYDDDDLEIVNPNDMNYCDRAWIVGVWSGVGYYVNRFLAFANNEGDALNETINYLVEKDYTRLAMSYDELYDEVKKFEDIDDGGEWSEEVDELIYRDYASNDDGTYFVRFENLSIEGIDIGIAKEIVAETLNESKVKKVIKEELLNIYELIDMYFSSPKTNIDNYPNFKKLLQNHVENLIKVVEQNGIPKIDETIKNNKENLFDNFYVSLCFWKFGLECVKYIRNEYGDTTLNLDNFNNDFKEYANKFYNYIIEIVYKYFGKKKTIKEENTGNKMETDKKHERLFFENFKDKLHKNAFGFYEVYNWIYDMTGIMPHKDEVEMFINNWEKKGWIDAQSNRFDEKVYLISKAERTMQKVPIVKNVPIAESKKKKLVKESVDIDNIDDLIYIIIDDITKEYNVKRMSDYSIVELIRRELKKYYRTNENLKDMIIDEYCPDEIENDLENCFKVSEERLILEILDEILEKYVNVTESKSIKKKRRIN